ncbi:MAG TPA: deiodinase-related protein, partial [Ktedonobacterales bacterium]
MTWIILRGGTIAYKAAWTDASDVRDAMRGIARLGELRRRGGRLAPFWTERLGFRVVDQAAFTAGLERNGPRAVADFAAFMRHTPLDRLDE